MGDRFSLIGKSMNEIIKNRKKNLPNEQENVKTYHFLLCWIILKVKLIKLVFDLLNLFISFPHRFFFYIDS